MPVCPEDRNLLGIQWQQRILCGQSCLLFGLCSAPFLFNRLFDAIHRILQHKYMDDTLVTHFEDFFTTGPAHSNDCTNNLQPSSLFTVRLMLLLKRQR